jgi:hypothetical protein
MTQEDIIRMAREAGGYLAELPNGDAWLFDEEKQLVRFAALVADAEAKRIHDEGMVTVGHMRDQIAAEREACAKLCDARAIEYDGFSAEQNASEKLAAAIRARGQA